jgi:hypothetical protein
MRLERTPTDSDSDESENSIAVNEHSPLPGNTVSSGVEPVRHHVLYDDLERDKRFKFRTRIEDLTHLIHLQIAKVQFGVWYDPLDSPDTEISFSVEYERDVPRQSAAGLSVVYEHKQIRIEVGANRFPVEL